MANQLPILSQPAGSTEVWTLTLRDEQGDPIDYSSSTPTLSFRAWPGDDRAAITLADSSIGFASAAAGTVTLTIDGGDTGTMLGDYPFQVGLTSGGETTWRDAGILRFSPSPGAGAAPASYGTADGVRRLAGGWLDRLRPGGDQVNFADELLDAHAWTNRQVLARARAILERRIDGDVEHPEGSDLMLATDSAFDSLDEGGYSTAMRIELRLAVVRATLDAGGLLTAGDEGEAVVRANEHYAASVVLGRSLASTEDRARLDSDAAYHRGRANAMLNAVVFRVDDDDDDACDYVLGPA